MGKWERSQRRLGEPSDSGACLTPKRERGKEGIKDRRKGRREEGMEGRRKKAAAQF